MPLTQGPRASPQAATMAAVPALCRQQSSSWDPSCPWEGKCHVHQGAVMSNLGWQAPREHPVQGAKTLARWRECAPASSPLPKKAAPKLVAPS